MQLPVTRGGGGTMPAPVDQLTEPLPSSLPVANRTPLKAYLFVDRGPQRSRQPFGVSAVVTDGTFRDIFEGEGYASDGDFPKLAAVQYLLSHYPENLFELHTAGVQAKLDHWQRGNGLKSDGSRFIGDQYLPTVVAARSRMQLRILAPPSDFTPAFELAKSHARAALRNLRGRPDTLSTAEVIMNPNVILAFREVKAGTR